MTSKRALAVALLIISMAAITAGTTCDPPTGGGNFGTVTATFDGLGYTGVATTARITNPGNLLLIASENSVSEVNFSADAAVGTQTIGSSGSTPTFQVQTPGGIWVANPGPGAGGAGNNGSITILTLTATGATGTFFFTAYASLQGATGNKVVTSGNFSVTFGGI